MLYLMTSIEENPNQPVLPFWSEAIFTLKWREKASRRFLSGECIQWHLLRKRLGFWKNQRVYLFRLFGDQRDGMLLSNETRENRCAFASGIASSEVQCSLWGEIKAEWKTVTVDVERWRGEIIMQMHSEHSVLWLVSWDRSQPGPPVMAEVV